MDKGEKTRADIAKAAMDMASMVGLAGLSFGELATEVRMSKSGLFAHYRSKEKLQLAVLEYARERFFIDVISPSLRRKRGIPRIRALVANWVKWEDDAAGGCVFLAASVDCDDKPGVVRDYLWKTQKEWIGFLAKSARLAAEAGDFQRNVDGAQFAYEIYSLMLGYAHYKRLLGDRKAGQRQKRALERLLMQCSTGIEEKEDDGA
ncbi:MAG: TetR/AcrR family transcriptional regulator [Nitrospinota bacterium]|nr:TetR/AcrR family transcriptional regulator [Nitrospinota bacterium]